jgi:hypothetical protein
MAVNFIQDDTFLRVNNTDGGNFTYKAYASDSSGTDFNTTYNGSVHSYEAILTSINEIVTPDVNDFTGLWVPLQKQYTYKAFATNNSGGGFSTTYAVTHNYEATLITSVYIETPIASNFTGLWIPIQKSFTYVAYADYDNGDGFTESFSVDKSYFGILYSNVEIIGRQQTDFTGLWQLMNTKNTVYNYNVTAIETSGSGSYHSNTMGGAYNGPCAIYYKGVYERIYFAITEFYEDSAGDPITNGKTTHRIGFIDVKNNIVSNMVEIPFARPQALDTHTVPAIIVTQNGYVIVTFELLTGDGTSAHNSNIAIYRSNDPESIEDPITPGTHNFTLVSTVGGAHSYPKLFKLSNGYINLITRRDSGSNHAYMSIVRSINDGINWVNLSGTANTYTDIVDYDRVDLATDWYFYSYGIYGAEEYGINMMGVANEGPNGTSPDGTGASSHMKVIYFLHSDDGIIWENVHNYLVGTGGTSKNILTSGTIKYSELESNYKIDDVSTDVEMGFAILSATLNEEDGSPYILYGTVDRNVPLKDNCFTLLNLVHYDINTSSWILDDILNVYSLCSDTTYGNNFYGGSLGTLKVYNSQIIDVGINRPRMRFYNDPNKVKLYLPVFDGRKYMVVDTEVNNFGTGIVSGDYLTALSNTFSLDASNTLEPLLSELVIFRTYNGGESWTIVFEDADSRHQGYNGPYIANDGGAKANYTAIFKPMVRPYDGSKAGDKADFKIILGKRI